MSKKQKRTEPKQVPTKRQLSKWQRQTRIRRIVIVVAAVFLVGIIGGAGYQYYNNEIGPLHKIAIEVNDYAFNMDYYVKMLDAQIKIIEAQSGEKMGADTIYYYANFFISQAASQVVRDELVKQGANSLGINVTDEEIDEEIEQINWPDEEVYRDMIAASLLQEKLLNEYFEPRLNATMNQTHIQVMFVESEEVADDAITKIEGGGNFTELSANFSCNHELEGDLGWLPQELMPKPSIANVSSSLEPNEVSSICNESASKSVGYWLIKVTEKDEVGGEEEIKAEAILLGSEQEAQQVETELDAGGNFTDLAKEHSQHESKNNGGELGWLERGDMNSTTFDKVAFNLTLNEVSEPVKDNSVTTTGGCWVVNVLGKGEHELSEGVREELAKIDFDKWFKQQMENSTIINHLDEEENLKSWAIDRVIKGR